MWWSCDQYYTEEPKKSSKKGKKKKKRGKKGRKEESSDEEHAPCPSVIVGSGEMPEGALESDEEDGGRVTKSGKEVDELSKALDQNLDMWVSRDLYVMTLFSELILLYP